MPEYPVEEVPIPVTPEPAPKAPPVAPTVEPPPAEPAMAAVDAAKSVGAAEAASLVPIPVPRPARADRAAPTKFANPTSPLPNNRPALPAVARELPSVATLPSITGTAQRSIRAAATETGLPLDRTALIGVLNLDTGRKALLRLPNGRYRTVIVGDVLDGWRVSMIGVDAMRITRGGEDRTLLLVNR